MESPRLKKGLVDGVGRAGTRGRRAGYCVTRVVVPTPPQLARGDETVYPRKQPLTANDFRLQVEERGGRSPPSGARGLTQSCSKRGPRTRERNAPPRGSRPRMITSSESGTNR